MVVQLTTQSLSVSAKVDTSGISPLGCGHSTGRIYSGGRCFLDLGKHVRYTYNDNTALTSVDSLGFPTEIPTGKTQIKIILECGPVNLAGNYLLSFTSNLDNTQLSLSVIGNATLGTVSYSGGVISAPLTITGTATSTITIIVALSGGGSGTLPGFGAVSILTTDAIYSGKTGVQLAAEGKNWDPAYLDLWRWTDAKGETLRPFMARYNDLSGCNTIQNEASGLRVLTSADVKTLDHAVWTDFLPPILAVEFAQEISPHLTWWNFPINADSTFRQAVMTILKTASAYTKFALARGNELWNYQYLSTRYNLAAALDYFAGHSVTGFFAATGVSATAASRDLVLQTGDGANVSTGMAVSLGGYFVGTVYSISGDTVTLDRDSSYTTGTYTASFGSYNARIDYQMMKQEDVLQDALAVFANRSDFLSVVEIQTTSSLSSYYANTPFWLAVDPSRPSPVGRHDVISTTTYTFIDNASAEAASVTWQTNQAQAISDWHTAAMAGLSTKAADWASLVTSIRSYFPNALILPYEGGRHLIVGGMDSGWTGATISDALAVELATRADTSSANEYATAWWDAAKVFDSMTASFMIQGIPLTSGYWGVYDGTDNTLDAFGTQVLALGASTLKVEFGGSFVA